MSGGLRRLLRRVAVGQASAAMPWALAVVALGSTLIAVAGPRQIAVAETTALHQEMASLSSLDTGVAVTGQWTAFTNNRAGMLTTAESGQLLATVGRSMHPPVDSPPSQRWGGATAPAQVIRNPAAALVTKAPPLMEVVYRSRLSAHARLVSGVLPGTAGTGRISLTCPHGLGGTRSLRSVVLTVAVTAATAGRFALRPGSGVDLCPFQIGDPAIILRVTGVIRPTRPSSAYWQYDPVLAAPVLNNPANDPQWIAGAFIGPGELAALQAAFSGATFQGAWFFPLELGSVTAASLPALLAGLARLASTSTPFGFGLGHPFSSVPLTSSGLAGALGTFLSQQQAVAAIESLMVIGLFAAGLVLVMMCVVLAADSHRQELSLVRARGGSTAQAAVRLFARTCCVTAPAVAVGAALAVLAVPGATSTASWVLGGVAAVAALAGPAAAAAWSHRRPWQVPARGDSRPAGNRLAWQRRLVAELAVLVAAAGAVAALRSRGVVTASDPYLSAAPVLVAAASGLVVARLYPVFAGGLLAMAAARRGVVGFLGLARSARSRPRGLLPALTLVLTLTLVAFAAIITGSITSGQVAASWQQTGADVVAHAAGNTTVTPAARRALAAVPGVSATAAVYIATDNPPFAPTLVAGPAGAAPGGGPMVGLVVADPARYAALSGHTPWPRFPAGLLARGRGGSGGAVPVLASGAVAIAAGRGAATLVLDGTGVPVRIVGRIGASPAMPAGGPYVVVPSWALARFPSISGLDVLLATGTGISPRAARAAVARTMPGAQFTLRQQVLTALADSPAQRAGSRLLVLGIWTAAALSLIAVLFGLAVTAAERQRLMTRLAALGMSTRQARALALTDSIPLLTVAVGGMLAAVFALALAAAPALDLAVFTGASGMVPVRPALAALAVPAGAAIAATLATMMAERSLLRWRAIGVALRHEEAT